MKIEYNSEDSTDCDIDSNASTIEIAFPLYIRTRVIQYYLVNHKLREFLAKSNHIQSKSKNKFEMKFHHKKLTKHFCSFFSICSRKNCKKSSVTCHNDIAASIDTI